MQKLFSLDVAQLQQTPGARDEVLRLLYTLKGVVRGLHSQKSFDRFFEWLHPAYFTVIIEGTLNAFHEDDEVVLCTLKFLAELAHNRGDRMRACAGWSITGLVVFKETAKYVVQLLRLWECFQKKPVKSDAYKERWKHIKVICQLYYNMIHGNYVNFAICEYYEDNVFTVLSQMVFTTVTLCDYKELTAYKKVYKMVFMLFQLFFERHQELLFLKFEDKLIRDMVHFLVRGLGDSSFEYQSGICNCLSGFNEYVFERLDPASTRESQLVSAVKTFYGQSTDTWAEMLSEILHTIIFEHNGNVWKFQAVLHTTLVVANRAGLIERVAMNCLNKHERND